MKLTNLLMAALLGAATLAGTGGCATTQPELRQDTFDTRKKLAGELIARHDLTSAFAYADGLQRERPRDAEVWVLRGTIYRDKGMLAEAEADLREAVRLDGELAVAHAGLGVVLDLTHRSDLAENEHRRAVKLSPQNAHYLNNLAFSLFLRGKTADAIVFLARAARLDPTNHRIHTNLGFAYAASGDLRGAAHEFQMGGTPAEAKNNLGLTYERRGDLARAYDLYAEAARLDPASTRARANLAHAATALGRELPAALALREPADGAPSSARETDPVAPASPMTPSSPPASPWSPSSSSRQPSSLSAGKERAP
ncbi:MAG TPA: tetratricopeptide repeat protein [Polyangia bacterium]|nr:tetratricopeptide repeat protein [Polyangia bacterium]